MLALQAEMAKGIFADSQEGFFLVSEMLTEVKELLILRLKMSEARWRRVFLRSMFALLEAVISRYKGRAFEAKRYSKIPFPEKLLRMLEEGKIALRDGQFFLEELAPRTRENLTAAMKAYAHVLQTKAPMGGELALPEEFTIALLARNRVTHPKTPSGLNVTDEEINACKEIFEWIMASVKRSGEMEQKSLRILQPGLNTSSDAQMEFLRNLGMIKEK